MVKLIACDLDGTLLPRGEKRLSAEIEALVKKTVIDGKYFAVISGRDSLSLKKVFDFMQDDIYYIACGGSVCVKNGKRLYSRPVSAQSVDAAIKTAKAEGVGLVLCSDSKVFALGDTGFKNMIKNMYGDGAVIAEQSKDITEPVYKISFFGEQSKTLLPEESLGLRLFYNRSGWQEYINRFAGKAQAFSDLMMRLGVLAQETVAAGDDACDTDMLRKAGKAYAFTEEAAREGNAHLITDPREIFFN